MAEITALTISNKDEMRALRQELVAKAELVKAAAGDAREGARLARRTPDVVQINVAAQQLNVAETGGGTPQDEG